MADLTALEAIEKRIVESGRPMTRAEAITLAPLRMKRRRPSYGRSDEAIAEMEAARNQPTSAPSPSYGRSDEAIAEMEAARNQAPKATPVPATVPEDDISAMIQPIGNALSSEPVADEQPATAPMGNVSTEIGAPKTAPVIDEARMAALFRKTTGTAFNPKSRVDTARMADLTSFIEQDPERLSKSDTKIALDYYRTLK
jgi:hypothetical protein